MTLQMDVRTDGGRVGGGGGVVVVEGITIS